MSSYHLSTALARQVAGMSLIPVNPQDKIPLTKWGEYERQAADPATIEAWAARWRSVAFGIVCGGVSGGLEGLDFDNKGAPDAGTLLAEWRQLVELEVPGLAERLPCEQTQSGGYHLFWRCPGHVEKNLKLAQRPPTEAELADDPRAKAVTLIETRGEGGYILTSPAPGYTMLRGTVEDAPEITPHERRVMLAAARSLHIAPAPPQPAQQPAQGATAASGGQRPGDAYDAAADNAVVARLLEAAGWTEVHQRPDGASVWRRPGKPRGWSATLGHVAPGVFWAFSSSAAPFEPEQPYSPFQVYTLLEHGGDFTAAAKALKKQGYGGMPASVNGSSSTGQDLDAAEPGAPPARSGGKLDDGHAAEEIARRYAGQLGYDAGAQTWRRWTGTHWAALGEDSRMMVEVAGGAIRDAGMMITKSKVASVRYLAAAVMEREFTARPSLINFTNGTLNAQTMQLQPHSPDDNLIGCLPYDVQPGQAWPLIWETITDVLPDPAAQLAYMLHIGLAMLRDTRMYYSCFIVGESQAGKSTLLNLANLATGQQIDRFTTEDIFLNTLDGKQARAANNEKWLATVDEIGEDALRGRGEELFKIMASHGGVGMRRLHENEMTDNQWRPKLMFTTNNVPRLRDDSGAVAERLIILRCREGREETTRDRERIDRFGAEMGAWAAACIWLALQARDLRCYPRSAAMLASVNGAGEANPVRAWLNDRCVRDTGASASAAELYADYVSWCLSNGHRTATKSELGRKLGDMGRFGIRQHRGTGGARLWLNIRLAGPIESPSEWVSTRSSDTSDVWVTRSYDQMRHWAQALSEPINGKGVTQVTHSSQVLLNSTTGQTQATAGMGTESMGEKSHEIASLASLEDGRPPSEPQTEVTQRDGSRVTAASPRVTAASPVEPLQVVAGGGQAATPDPRVEYLRTAKSLPTALAVAASWAGDLGLTDDQQREYKTALNAAFKGRTQQAHTAAFELGPPARALIEEVVKLVERVTLPAAAGGE